MRSRLGRHSNNGISILTAPCRSRTCNLRFRRPTLYPIELKVLCFVERGILREGRGGFNSLRHMDPQELLAAVGQGVEGSGGVEDQLTSVDEAAEGGGFGFVEHHMRAVRLLHAKSHKLRVWAESQPADCCVGAPSSASTTAIC